ncbi:branched-chain amino acid ABC transporter ATP-binding protein, partial [Pseudomonas syringae pv. actinidiae ICMP 18807]
MLNVSNLNVYYGDSHVLRDLSLDLAPGESLAIMGRNGMGKTTLLRSL